MLSQEELAHVARLARLDMDADALARMAGQLDAILRYAAKLNEVETTGVEPYLCASGVVNAMRNDELKPSLAREAALKNAPAQNGEAFIVPRVIS